MYYWVTGFNTAGQPSLAGPYQSRSDALDATQGWQHANVFELNTPDRQAAIPAINASRSRAASISPNSPYAFSTPPYAHITPKVKTEEDEEDEEFAEDNEDFEED